MKVRLLRDARINHKAGEIVEVSPSEMGFLIDVGSAEVVEDKAKSVEAVSEPEKEAEPKKTAKVATALKKATTKKK